LADSRAGQVRRVIAAVVLLAQFFFVVGAYSADHAFFGFQMFPESSQWQATIERELADGRRIDVGDPWPGGYAWGDLVVGRGLNQPYGRHHADTGLRSTLHFFAAALDWAAHNTPLDTETVRLVATVTTWHNGGPPETLIMEANR
jgi:hypothetical protein